MPIRLNSPWLAITIIAMIGAVTAAGIGWALVSDHSNPDVNVAPNGPDPTQADTGNSSQPSSGNVPTAPITTPSITTPNDNSQSSASNTTAPVTTPSASTPSNIPRSSPSNDTTSPVNSSVTTPPTTTLDNTTVPVTAPSVPTPDNSSPPSNSTPTPTTDPKGRQRRLQQMGRTRHNGNALRRSR